MISLSLVWEMRKGRKEGRKEGTVVEGKAWGEASVVEMGGRVLVLVREEDSLVVEEREGEEGWREDCGHSLKGGGRVLWR